MPLSHHAARDSGTPDAASVVPHTQQAGLPAASRALPPLTGVPVPAGASLPAGTSFATLHAAFQSRQRTRTAPPRLVRPAPAAAHARSQSPGGATRAAVDSSVATWRLRNTGRFSARVLGAATVAVTAVALSAGTAQAVGEPTATGQPTPSTQPVTPTPPAPGAAASAPAPADGGPDRILLAEPSPAWPRGIDIASWQHPGSAPIDWNAVKGSGVSFAIVKATEGTNYTNPYFTGDRTAARQAGLTVGAYHYARPAAPISTAVDQARHFLAVTGLTRMAGHLAPVLDIETTGGLDPVALTAWTRAFLEEVESQTGRAPIIYTYRSFWTDHMADTRDFAHYPFWFAIYNNETTPGWLPGGWPGWAMWQYTSSGTVPGISGNVDMNVACCSPAELAGLADGTLSEIDRRFASAGLLQYSLGAPTGVELRAGGGGRWRPFANGLIFWSVTTGPRVLHGEVARKYLELGGSDGFLQRPLSDVEWATAPGAHQAMFQGGWIYWHPTTGAHEVHGLILRRYLELGGSTSALGLPVTDEYSVPGGRESTFQFGKLRWTAATNAVTLLPATAP
ncbi:GH25 family lysozyme [Parafrankia elaeagni]|uniref:GH25 family lysozyme n=1 Tax=Parafrankia elaeagni TaxID=222534 RepID=UPI0003A04812|nr:GH25 family lysozyme [Parafrankia elaeagni]